MILYEDPKLSKITSKLKKMRLMKQYTQESLAEISGVNIKSLASYEQDPSKLLTASAITVYKLADALNCEMDDILNKEKIYDTSIGGNK
jgi:transcriptional regulator with XRE-family HTH domain